MNQHSPGTEFIVDGLTIRFGGLTAVDGMSFEVRTGEVLSLIGPNGAGKTTAFNAITGYIEPNAGTIMYRGASLNGLKPNQIAERGVVLPSRGVGGREAALVSALGTAAPAPRPAPPSSPGSPRT